MDVESKHSANTPAETDASGDVSLPRVQRRPGRPPGAPKPPGSGRQKGVPNRVTREIREVAAKHGEKAVRELVRLMQKAEREDVRLKAAAELLDRAYGRPTQTQEIGGIKDGEPIQRVNRVIVSPMNPMERAQRLAGMLRDGGMVAEDEDEHFARKAEAKGKLHSDNARAAEPVPAPEPEPCKPSAQKPEAAYQMVNPHNPNRRWR